MTNKNHFLLSKVYTPQRPNDGSFSNDEAALVMIPDSARYCVDRNYTHCTINPDTGDIAGIAYPTSPPCVWDEKALNDSMIWDAGIPSKHSKGTPAIDEATIPEKFWDYNSYSDQNFLFYLHLVQDVGYDRFIRSVIDTSGKYEDIYVFKGKTFTGSEIRKSSDCWSEDGLLNILDNQMYVRLAKMYYEKTGILANIEWIENVLKQAVYSAYSPELAQKTIPFVKLSDYADEIITTANFDEEWWPIENFWVDQAIQWMLEDMYNAMIADTNRWR